MAVLRVIAGATLDILDSQPRGTMVLNRVKKVVIRLLVAFITYVISISFTKSADILNRIWSIFVPRRGALPHSFVKNTLNHFGVTPWSMSIYAPSC